MQLGFVSAILSDLSLEDVLKFASDEGFQCVELMCWPVSKAERRYAGVTHVDVTNFTPEQGQRVKDLAAKHGVSISSLGYYPNPLDPDPAHRELVIGHLRKVIAAAPLVGTKIVNTFIGRDWHQTIEDNFNMIARVWPGILDAAKAAGVTIGIEHCPMLFSNDEWPGGKNVAISPAVWRRLFQAFPTAPIGLNFDPSHLIWQFIDAGRALREFGRKIVHVHAKDERINPDKLYEGGVMGLGWHTPKLPGLGDVKWPEFFSSLTDTGYNGAVCIEVEDRAFDRDFADRRRALRQSKKFLEQFVA
ncbi:sugar phosphate isomerase/epimerase family protein [Limnoglobus roseus]|uniref:Sugar phosphate isomerase/epimerase n=1 Tax=Limnoglobus roseus TaxID=2598579 RepID=A0A5C1AA73_9BACT|nr:sugar phosphate isomerase/epimerase [Limnoglobus roseus]QEL13948.1 sugar phosphate isomerase/epimerase [Limnoglobus roseus]